MSRRLLILLAAAATIAGLSTWRVVTNRPQDYARQIEEAELERPAAAFEALDSDNQMFRLERYLGRHRVLVVFYSAADTAAASRHLLAVREEFEELSRRDVKVVGVSTALPQHNRAAMEHSGPFPFPLVTDVDLTIHRRWGRVSADTGEPLEGVFLIDRKGAVPSLGDQPRPVDDVPTLLKELTQ
jgi:peroxiredoxin